PAPLHLHSFPTRRSSDLRRSEAAAEINEQHRNARYLPDIALPASLRATSDLDAALAHVLQADRDSLIILGVPVAGMRETCRTLADRKSTRLNSSHVKISY